MELMEQFWKPRAKSLEPRALQSYKRETINLALRSKL